MEINKEATNAIQQQSHHNLVHKMQTIMAMFQAECTRQHRIDKCIPSYSNKCRPNPLIAILKLQSNGPSYSNTVIGTLAVDGWAVTFGTVRRGLGRAPARPGPSSLYQMQHPIHQRPVYQLRIIRYGIIIAFGV